MAERAGLPVFSQTRCRSLIRTSQGIHVTTGARPRPRVVSSCTGIKHMSRGQITAVRYQVRQCTTSVLIITQRIDLRFFFFFWGRLCVLVWRPSKSKHTEPHTHDEDRNFSFKNSRCTINTDRCLSREWCPEQKSCPWRWSSPAKYPCRPVCASPWRQPGLFGDDTHAKRKRSMWA